MREKIVEVLKHRGVDTLFNEHVAGAYGKEDAPNCENYINTTTDQILKELSEEIEKVENPNPKYIFAHSVKDVRWMAVEEFRQKILALLK